MVRKKKEKVIEDLPQEKNIEELEQEAVIKYERQGYKSPKYRPIQTQIKCQKCGSIYNLTKSIVDGQEYWFCKDCIIERAKQLRNRTSKNI